MAAVALRHRRRIWAFSLNNAGIGPYKNLDEQNDKTRMMLSVAISFVKLCDCIQEKTKHGEGEGVGREFEYGCSRRYPAGRSKCSCTWKDERGGKTTARL